MHSKTKNDVRSNLEHVPWPKIEPFEHLSRIWTLDPSVELSVAVSIVSGIKVLKLLLFDRFPMCDFV